MKNIIIRCLAGATLICAASACVQNNSAGNHAVENTPSHAAIIAQADSACAIALTPVLSGEAQTATDQAIVRYQQAVPNAVNPLARLERLGWAYISKARESHDAGFYTLAQQVAMCQQAIEPGSVEPKLLQAHALHNLHQFKQAEALARELVVQRGMWFDHALLGDVLTERGQLDEAAEAYQNAAGQRPGPQLYLRIAQLRWLKGDLEGALSMYAQSLRGISPRTPEAAAWTYVRYARLLFQAQQPAAAEYMLEQALALQSGYAPALHARGQMLLAQSQPQAALTWLQQAVQADPLPEYRWTLLEALETTGHATAVQKQRTALDQSGASEDPRTYALFLATRGDDTAVALDLAMHELEQRMDVFTLDAVAWALSRAGQQERALAYSQQALAAGTQHARLFLHAGIIAADNGHQTRGLDLLQRARDSQQMLLPSEQRLLTNELEALEPQALALTGP